MRLGIVQHVRQTARATIVILAGKKSPPSPGFHDGSRVRQLIVPIDAGQVQPSVLSTSTGPRSPSPGARVKRFLFAYAMCDPRNRAEGCYSQRCQSTGTIGDDRFLHRMEIRETGNVTSYSEGGCVRTEASHSNPKIVERQTAKQFHKHSTVDGVTQHAVRDDELVVNRNVASNRPVECLAK